MLKELLMQMLKELLMQMFSAPETTFLRLNGEKV